MRWPSVALLASLTLGAAAAPAQENPAADDGLAEATFAGGCFWCMEHAYDKLDGVVSTTSGYTGGDVADPTYEQVSAGGTGHAEAVRVVYDPSRVDYETLLQAFWHNVDPTQADGQFCDHGDQYRSAVFYHDEEQKRRAERSRAELEKTKPFAAEIVTEIAPAGPFYEAEAYHQDYYEKNPFRYKFYRWGCGRDDRLAELWGDQAGKPSS